MKRIKYLAVMAAAVLSLSACDPETVPTNIDVASEIEGTWTCERNDGEFNDYYDVEITKTGEGEVTISNFHNFSESVTVKVYDDNSLVLESQTISSTTFEGSGSVSSGYQSISLDYTATDQDGTVNITTTYSLGTVVKKLQ